MISFIYTSCDPDNNLTKMDQTFINLNRGKKNVDSHLRNIVN